MSTTKRRGYKPPPSKLHKLKTHVWVQGCLRSYCRYTGKTKGSFNALANAAHSEDYDKSQPIQWKRWLEGGHIVHQKTVENIGRSVVFAGTQKLFTVGPWQPGDWSYAPGWAKILCGAHVPLWDVISAEKEDLPRIWGEVPRFVWRHWMPWESMNFSDEEIRRGELANFLHRQMEFPETDYLHPEFTWQLACHKVFKEALLKHQELYMEALASFVDPQAHTSLARQDRDAALQELEKVMADHARKLHCAELLKGVERKRILLDQIKGVESLQKSLPSTENNPPQPGFDLAGPTRELKERVRHELNGYLESGNEEDEVELNDWVPAKVTFRNEAALARFLSGIGRYDGLTPPLVVLAAAISLAKLEKIHDNETLSYRVEYVDQVTSPWQVHEDYWPELVAELEKYAMTIDSLNAAAAEFGVFITRYGTHEREIALEEEMASFAGALGKKRKV